MSSIETSHSFKNIARGLIKNYVYFGLRMTPPATAKMKVKITKQATSMKRATRVIPCNGKMESDSPND